MRTLETDQSTLASICLLVDSHEILSKLEERYSRSDARCITATSLVDFHYLLENERPALIVASLEFAGQCVLEFCREHPHLLADVPVVFLATDPRSDFEQSLEAIRLGAIDVLATPLDFEKLDQLCSLARDRYQVALETSPQDAFAFEVPERTLGLSKQSEKNISKPSSFRSASSMARRSADSPAIPSDKGGAFQGSHPSEVTTRAIARSQRHRANVRELESWILGSSPAMQSVREIIAEVAETKANVMIYGASGTGKELVATAVHKLSNRCSGPFEPVNMTEIPHDLAESLLFGHEKGAFTGADFRQIGVCEAADGGTLFLDEIGEMALATQPKLLRFLQEGTVKRIGATTNKQVDVRVITATNRSPQTIVKEGRLREDLFFRLHVVPIYIPPLQDRPEDIEQLAMLFLRRYVKAYHRKVDGFTQAALDVFRLHDWPGNVRQLENVVERLVVFAKGNLIDVADIPAEIHAASMFGESSVGSDSPDACGGVLFNASPYKVDGQAAEAASAVASMSAMQRTERAAIIEALQRCGGHVIDASRLLGLGQATVYRKIKQYHIPHQRRRRRRSPK